MRRRELLGAIGLLGAGALFSGAAGPWTGLFMKATPLVESEVRLAMGTLLQISLAGQGGRPPANAGELLDLAFAEAGRLEALLTRHKPGSPLFNLNAVGCINVPPAELRHVLAHALHHCRESIGFFDPTVASAAPCGIDGISLAEDQISFAQHGTALTLDGIAKGYVVDRVSQLLRAHGAGNHLINAGGDIIAYGAGPSGSGWKIGLRDPLRPGRILTSFFLRDGAVATSGNYESMASRGRAHILRPGAGTPADGMLSASAFAASAMEADAMSTAIFAMPTEILKDFITADKKNGCMVLHKVGGLEKIGTLFFS